MQPLAQHDDQEAQEPLVLEATAGTQSGWGVGAKLGISVSSLALVVVAVVTFHSSATTVVRSSARGEQWTSFVVEELGSVGESLLNTAPSADDLEKELVDDMPIYTDQIAIGEEVDDGPSKLWTINFKTEYQSMDKDARDELAETVFGDKVSYVGEAMPMIMVLCTHAELKELLVGHHDKFAFVEQDVKDKAIPLLPPQSDRRLGSQSNPPSWGLDRVDQNDLPLQNQYTPDSTDNDGRGVHIYVMDTGVRCSHSDFGGRAIPTLQVLGDGRRDTVKCNGDRNCAVDRDGHGTHCAGTSAGAKYGIAKKAVIHAVKILSDTGAGSFSWFEKGIDWIAARGEKPSVISASLGAHGRLRSTETAINTAVNMGVVVVVAAGNENDNACSYTPSYIPKALTIGSTKADDGRSSFSNKGNCVDLFAPGSDIVSAGVTGNTAIDTMSGTSMACPHVAGACALVLSGSPTMSAVDVGKYLVEHGTEGSVHGQGGGSPDLLLYVGGNGEEHVPAPTPPANPDCAGLGWTVTEGQCTIDSNCCLKSPNFPDNYPSSSACKVQVGSNPGQISVGDSDFHTEADWDKLLVPTTELEDGWAMQYHGDASPHGIIPKGDISWSADGSVEAGGFKLCLAGVGSCPANGWMLQAGCLQTWKYKGQAQEGCATVDHHGGWCIKKHARGHFFWTDCIKCS